jgi:hypothetical protein
MNQNSRVSNPNEDHVWCCNKCWTVRSVTDNGVEKFEVSSLMFRIAFVVDDLARAELLFSTMTMMTEDGHDMLVVRK